MLREVANPRAPIQEVSEPPRKFFDDVVAHGTAVKYDIGASGKWIRVATRIGDTPYAAIAGVFIPATMNRLIDESIILHKNFQQLDAQRPTLKASQTSLFLAITLAILSSRCGCRSTHRGASPSRSKRWPRRRKLAEGDGSRVDVVAGDEVGRLIESFNQMSRQLDQQRQALTQTNQYLSTVLDSVSAGIIAFSDDFHLLSINRAALQMLQIDEPAARLRWRKCSPAIWLCCTKRSAS